MNKGVACPYNSLNRIEVNQDPDIQSRENRLETSNEKKTKNTDRWNECPGSHTYISNSAIPLLCSAKQHYSILNDWVYHIAISDGLRSINKFRKGYDINISGEVERDDGERTKNTNDE